MSKPEPHPSRAHALEAIFARIPMVQTIGMRCDIKGDDMVAVLPYQDKLIGNFTIKARRRNRNISRVYRRGPTLPSNRNPAPGPAD